MNLLRQMKDPKFVEDVGIVILVAAAALMLQGYSFKLMLLS